uniref:Uncharacterized protein n=1 Tax=Eptatretus burgeri TaxID=7764 RepID=A0A8C4QG76_EPTBU
MDVMGDEIKRETSEAMGREMAAVREEVRECCIGVRVEMRESEARLMGQVRKIKEIEGLTIGQNELKEQIEKNTGAIKEFRAAEKETTREMTTIKNECKMAHEKLTNRVEEVTQTMETKEREMETQIETKKVTLEGEIQEAHRESTMVKEEVEGGDTDNGNKGKGNGNTNRNKKGDIRGGNTRGASGINDG